MLLFAYSVSEIPCPPDRVEELAASGYNKYEIAQALGMSFNTFRARLENTSVRAAYERGRQIHGSFVQRAAKTGFDDEGVPYLNAQDEMVLAAVEQKRCKKRKLPDKKRISLLRILTNLTDRQIVKSLERLEIHQKVTRTEGVYFIEFESTE